jgi:hypothetical protein
MPTVNNGGRFFWGSAGGSGPYVTEVDLTCPGRTLWPSGQIETALMRPQIGSSWVGFHTPA